MLLYSGTESSRRDAAERSASCGKLPQKVAAEGCGAVGGRRKVAAEGCGTRRDAAERSAGCGKMRRQVVTEGCCGRLRRRIVAGLDHPVPPGHLSWEGN